MKLQYLIIAVLGFTFFFTSCEQTELDGLEPTPSLQTEKKALPSFESEVEKIEVEANTENELESRSGRVRFYSRTFSVSRGRTITLYLNKADLRTNKSYEAVITPISGDPDLYARGFYPSRMIDSNIAYGTSPESVTVVKSDLLSGETRLGFSIYGYTNAQFKIELFMNDVAGGGTSTSDCNCGTGANAGTVLICDNFSSYSGYGIVNQASHWVSRNPGLSVEADLMSQWNSYTGLTGKFLQFNYVSGLGGQHEMYLRAGNYSSGIHKVAFDMEVASGKGAYLELQRYATYGTRGERIYFNGDGTGFIQLMTGDNLAFDYPRNAEFSLELKFDLNRRVYHLRIVRSATNYSDYYWAYPLSVSFTNRFGGIFFGTNMNNRYSIDNVCFETGIRAL